MKTLSALLFIGAASSLVSASSKRGGKKGKIITKEREPSKDASAASVAPAAGIPSKPEVMDHKGKGASAGPASAATSDSSADKVVTAADLAECVPNRFKGGDGAKCKEVLDKAKEADSVKLEFSRLIDEANKDSTEAAETIARMMDANIKGLKDNESRTAAIDIAKKILTNGAFSEKDLALFEKAGMAPPTRFANQKFSDLACADQASPDYIEATGRRTDVTDEEKAVWYHLGTGHFGPIVEPDDSVAIYFADIKEELLHWFKNLGWINSANRADLSAEFLEEYDAITGANRVATYRALLLIAQSRSVPLSEGKAVSTETPERVAMRNQYISNLLSLVRRRDDEPNRVDLLEIMLRSAPTHNLEAIYFLARTLFASVIEAAGPNGAVRAGVAPAAPAGPAASVAGSASSASSKSSVAAAAAASDKDQTAKLVKERLDSLSSAPAAAPAAAASSKQRVKSDSTPTEPLGGKAKGKKDLTPAQIEAARERNKRRKKNKKNNKKNGAKASDDEEEPKEDSPAPAADSEAVATEEPKEAVAIEEPKEAVAQEEADEEAAEEEPVAMNSGSIQPEELSIRQLLINKERECSDICNEKNLEREVIRRAFVKRAQINRLLKSMLLEELSPDEIVENNKREARLVRNFKKVFGEEADLRSYPLDVTADVILQDDAVEPRDEPQPEPAAPAAGAFGNLAAFVDEEEVPAPASASAPAATAAAAAAPAPVAASQKPPRDKGRYHPSRYVKKEKPPVPSEEAVLRHFRKAPQRDNNYGAIPAVRAVPAAPAAPAPAPAAPAPYVFIPDDDEAHVEDPAAELAGFGFFDSLQRNEEGQRALQQARQAADQEEDQE